MSTAVFFLVLETPDGWQFSARLQRGERREGCGIADTANGKGEGIWSLSDGAI